MLWYLRLTVSKCFKCKISLISIHNTEGSSDQWLPINHLTWCLKSNMKYSQWEVYWCCPSSTSGMLLLSRELPQDETARRISSLPHILILSWAWTTHTAATSTTIRDTKRLAADIVWCVAAPRLVSGERKNWKDARWLTRWAWGGLYSPCVLPVEVVSKMLRPQSLRKYVFSLGEGKACPDLELSMTVTRSLLKAETLIEIKNLIRQRPTVRP